MIKFEQVALRLIIHNSRKSFRRTLMSTRAKILLVGSFDGRSDVVNDYVKQKYPGVDLRKKTSEEVENLRGVLTSSFLPDAKAYSSWIREHSFKPIWEEALVSYCGAFEACLKSIAMAFYIGRNQADGLRYEIFMPGGEITEARRLIAREWSKEVDDLPKCQSFYKRFVSNSQYISEFPEHALITDEAWDVCSAAFQIRNFIVHNLSVASSTVELGSATFHAGSRVDFKFSHLRTVENAFELVLSPFSDAFEDLLDDDILSG